MMKEQVIGQNNIHHKVTRTWGYYKVLYDSEGFRVKELVINPKSSLSMQKHQHRSETWNIVSGECYVLIDNEKIKLEESKGIFIPVNTWHKGINNSNKPAHVIEIWRGNHLTEDDIERKKLIM